MLGISVFRLIHRGNRRIFLAVHLGITLSFFLLSLVWISGRNSLSFARKTLIGDLPGQELLVETRKTSLAMFQILEPGAQENIGDSTIRALSGLPGVTAVFPVKYASIPVAIEGRFLGVQFGTDALIQGFEPAWIAGDVSPDGLDWQPSQPIPVVLNLGILALYNNGYAKSNGLPELSAKALLGRKFNLMLRNRKGRRLTLKARVAGLSPKVAMGVTLPNSVLDQLHTTLDEAPPPIRQAVLRVEPLSDPAPIRQAVSALGFQLQQAAPLAAAVNRVSKLGRIAALALVAVAVWVIFAYLNQSVKLLLMAKRRDYAMCRAMGLSRNALRRLIAAEILIWTVADVVLGCLIACAVFLVGYSLFVDDVLVRIFGLGLDASIPTWDLIALAGAVILGCVALIVPRIIWDTRADIGIPRADV